MIAIGFSLVHVVQAPIDPCNPSTALHGTSYPRRSTRVRGAADQRCAPASPGPRGCRARLPLGIYRGVFEGIYGGFVGGYGDLLVNLWEL